MSSTVPLWVAVVLGLSSPIVAVVALVAAGIRDSKRLEYERDREYRRLEHEQEMQRLELEERRWTTLREDRIRAYSALARLTGTVAAGGPHPVRELSEAHSEIELLTDDARVREAADMLVQAAGHAWQTARNAHDAGADNPYGTPQFEITRKLLDARRRAFIEFAKEEVAPRALSREEVPHGSIPSEALPGL